VFGGRLRGAAQLASRFVLAAIVLAAGLALMGTVPSVAWLLPCGVVVGAGNGVLNVTLSSLVMGRARDEERGRIGALLTGVASGTQLAAFVVGGVLAEAFSPRAIFAVAGLLGLVAPVVLGRRLVRSAAEPVPAAEAPAAAPA
jgi:MFS family permease